jgi:hypothetical protein
MDLGTPAGRGRARFVTHPQGPFRVTRRDDLAAVVLVAVPPWDERSIAAFDRAGRRLTLAVVDAEPPRDDLAAVDDVPGVDVDVDANVDANANADADANVDVDADAGGDPAGPDPTDADGTDGGADLEGSRPDGSGTGAE